MFLAQMFKSKVVCPISLYHVPPNEHTIPHAVWGIALGLYFSIVVQAGRGILGDVLAHVGFQVALFGS
jgi:hypothetical protein